MADPAAPPLIRVVHDGQCPFCAAFVRMARLRAAAGEVVLVDARSDDPAVGRARAAGLDLDEGMVVEMDGRLHHGEAAMVVLAALTTRSGAFNRMVRLGFARPWTARILYPILRLGRRAALRVLGRPPIGGE